MKKHLFSFILAGFILVSLSTFGQNKNYPTKKVNGVEYYSYTVQPGDGLLAIGRKFEISADDISKANPEVKQGLKIGQQILIPVQNKTKNKLQAKAPEIKPQVKPENKPLEKSANKPDEKSNNKPQVEKKNQIEFIQHKVEKKQTLFAISHKYNVNQDDIIKYNPEVKTGLKEGLILKIPTAKIEKKQKEAEKPVVQNTKYQSSKTNENPQFIIHIVKSKETLFSISKRYNVEINEITKINKDAATKLTVGSELKIPIKKESPKLNAVKKDSTSQGSNLLSDVFKILNKNNSSKFAEKKIIRIAYLLPFMLEQGNKQSALERFQNFYAGSLLAIDQEKKKGISFEIYTYDTENSEDKITEVLNNSELKTMDLIIGPAFSNQVPIVSRFAKEYKVNTLIPFTSKVPDIDSNPYLFQFNPGPDTELNYLSELLSGKYKKSNIVFADVSGISSLDDGRYNSDELKKDLKRMNRSFSKIELISSEQTDFSRVLKKGENNLVIFNTNKYSNVSPYIKSLSSKTTKYDVILYEQYNWRNQTEKMPNGIYISPFISNFNQIQVNDFDAKFNQYFGKDVTEDTPRFDLLGYDLTNYFINLISRYGNKYGNKIELTNLAPGIQSHPIFKRTSSDSGFINQQVYLGEDKAQ